MYPGKKLLRIQSNNKILNTEPCKTNSDDKTNFSLIQTALQYDTSIQNSDIVIKSKEKLFLDDNYDKIQKINQDLIDKKLLSEVKPLFNSRL